MNSTVKSLIKTKLTKNQLAAIESFIEDRGLVIFKNSRLLKVINNGELELVPDELAKWTVENGQRKEELVELRNREIELFTK